MERRSFGAWDDRETGRRLNREKGFSPRSRLNLLSHEVAGVHNCVFEMDRFLIVDGHAYAYRAFHAIRELRSPTGEPTNAIYGFIKMLIKMRARLSPTHLMVVWDGGLSEDRVAALPEYKAQRPEMPADLEKQLDGILEYLGAAGVPSFCQDGIEADDYIACLANCAVRSGMEVVIASSDKDFMQLVSPNVGLFNPNDKTETVWGAEEVVKKTGVKPPQIVDWLSLVGDSVDNIPGVPGVGTKTATSLLNEFGSIAELYSRLDEVKSDRLRNALKMAEGDVSRNQKLVRLNDDLPCKFSASGISQKPMDADLLATLFRRWGFRSMLAELKSTRTAQQALL